MSVLVLLGCIFHFYSNFKSTFNSVEPDQTPRSAASDLIIHCFRVPHEKSARLIWINGFDICILSLS